ncbi:MAG: hypothetical protein AAB482_00080 [Patescibacteria group bacterium]
MKKSVMRKTAAQVTAKVRPYTGDKQVYSLRSGGACSGGGTCGKG